MEQPGALLQRECSFGAALIVLRLYASGDQMS